ncbi:MAG: hypothetical protein AAF431_19815 [Pseudomonadota bacterium]
MSSKKRPPLNEAALHAAADKLEEIGKGYCWWPASTKPWRELDPIGKNEFLGAVEEVVMAYLNLADQG